MAIDISKVFKANVKAIRMSLSDGSPNADVDALNEQLLKTKNKKPAANSSKTKSGSIDKQAKNIIHNITVLKDFLNENKKFYIQPNYLVFQSNEVNEVDWQNFEDQAESIIKKCSDAIGQLKQTANQENFNVQYKEHIDNLLYLLEKYLKDVCKVYSEQKAIRVKRTLERKNYSQLFSTNLASNSSPNENESLKVKKFSNLTSEQIAQNEQVEVKSIENNLSPQELLALEKENELLFESLSSQTEEIKKIESDVIEVSRLTQIFTENIVSQLSTVESIQKSAIETNSNLTIGNDDIKEVCFNNINVWVYLLNTHSSLLNTFS